MQFQADMLGADINRSGIEEASALGAVVMNGFARGVWKSFREVAAIMPITDPISPRIKGEQAALLHKEWKAAVQKVIN